MIRRTITLLLTATATLTAVPAGAQTAGGGEAQVPLHAEREVVYRTIDGRDLALDAAGVDYELVITPTDGHVPEPVPEVTVDSIRFLRAQVDGDDPVIPTTPGSGGAAVPDDSDARSFEIALLVMGVAAIVLGACLVALSRRRRPRPRSPLPAVRTPKRAGSLTDVTTPRDTTSVGRRS